jgi:HSP20 family protein
MPKERTQDTHQQDQRESNAAQSGPQPTGTQQGGITRRERGQASPVILASPFSLMRQLMEDLDQLVAGGTATGGATLARRSGRDALWVPPIEVSEEDGQLVVRADAPGVNRDQIEVEIDDGQLIISGERKEEHEERRGESYRTELSYGRFYRAIPLPDGVHPEQAQATFNNGVLEIRIPYPTRRQAQRVQVQDGAKASQTKTSQTSANAA